MHTGLLAQVLVYSNIKS